MGKDREHCSGGASAGASGFTEVDLRHQRRRRSAGVPVVPGAWSEGGGFPDRLKAELHTKRWGLG